jgi:hypothetical protein
MAVQKGLEKVGWSAVATVFWKVAMLAVLLGLSMAVR